MSADLLIYALVAAGLIFWLRSVLGTRHEEENERPAAFLNGDDSADSCGSHGVGGEPIHSAEEQITALVQTPRNNYGIENKTAENGLIDIARADKNFDIDAFMKASQDAFALIVECFAEGDRDMLVQLLDPKVFAAFEHAIKEREERGEKQITEIHAIRNASVSNAILDDRMAKITVKFIAEETSVTRNSDDEIIAGDPNTTIDMNDIWVFSRDIKSKDPSWLVLETRGDVENDNDLIPDSH